MKKVVVGSKVTNVNSAVELENVDGTVIMVEAPNNQGLAGVVLIKLDAEFKSTRSGWTLANTEAREFFVEHLSDIELDEDTFYTFSPEGSYELV